MNTRTEKDSMGEMQVPVDAWYGASTARAVDNFPISGRGIPAAVVHALGWIKWAAAQANAQLGVLDAKAAALIVKAARDVADGACDHAFVVDVYQTGSGTSSNMNANEVIAYRANQLAKTKDARVHPNDHVNFGQSSNDVFPTAIHLATAAGVVQKLLPALVALEKALAKKAKQFHGVFKSGRTHLQDATPIRLGQEFSGYAHQVLLCRERLNDLLPRLCELPLGGTAVGTGVNTHPRFAKLAIGVLKKQLKLPLRETRNHFQAQASPDTLVELGAALKTAAVALSKIGNDIRWLASGPRCGLGELIMPAVQPGSSIMPGKVNPVIIESLLMVCARVIGNDAVLNIGGLGGVLELNMMYPVMGDALCESIDLLSAVCVNVATKCIDGLQVDAARCKELLDANLSVGTSLAPVIGYDASSALVKKAFSEGTTFRALAERETNLTKKQLDQLLDPAKQTQPGAPRAGSG